MQPVTTKLITQGNGGLLDMNDHADIMVITSLQILKRFEKVYLLMKKE